MTFQIKLAGCVVEVNTKYNRVWYQCRAYLTEGRKPDFVIDITEEDLKYELEMNDLLYGTETKVDNFELEREVISLNRKVAEAMLDVSAFLLHGAVVSDGSEAFMFSAKSGTGKTTRALLFKAVVPEAYIINGDKPLIRVLPNEILACGTPWCGKENLNTNTQEPLRAIFLLQRAAETKIEKIKPDEAFFELIKQAYLPKDSSKRMKTLFLLRELCRRVDVYRYYSEPTAESVRAAYETAKGWSPVSSDANPS